MARTLIRNCFKLFKVLMIFLAILSIFLLLQQNTKKLTICPSSSSSQKHKLNTIAYRLVLFKNGYTFNPEMIPPCKSCLIRNCFSLQLTFKLAAISCIGAHGTNQGPQEDWGTKRKNQEMHNFPGNDVSCHTLILLEM